MPHNTCEVQLSLHSLHETIDKFAMTIFRATLRKIPYFALYLRVFDSRSKIRNVHAAEVEIALKIVPFGMLHGINLAVERKNIVADRLV